MNVRTSSRSSAYRSNRGSVLIVSLLLSAAIAVSIGSYMTLSRSSLQLSNRSFYNTAAVNLAETGIEEALWSFNQVTAGASLWAAWTGWTVSGSVAKRTFTDFSLNGNVTASVRVMVDIYNPTAAQTPRVFSESVVTLPNDTRTITKTVEVMLRRRSRFAMGLVARNQIRFNGNTASVNSWNSLYDDAGNLRGTPVAYGDAYKRDSGSIGSTSVAVGSVAVNNADIWGFASVGSSSVTDLSVGTNGIVGAFGSTAGYVDTTRVATDFTANFDVDTNPTTGSTLSSVGATLGTTGATATYRFAGQITTSLTISGHVTLILTAAAGVDAIRLTGTDQLTIDAGSSLIIYTAADVKLVGGGLVNPNAQATSFQLYGTNPTSQNINLGGTSGFNGIVYAPNANVSIEGNPDVTGSIVANNITVQGNAHFHYDESLDSFGANNPYGVVKWRELLTSTERTTAFATW